MNEGAVNRNGAQGHIKGIRRNNDSGIFFIKRLNVPVHICHVSTAVGVEIIRNAKRTVSK